MAAAGYVTAPDGTPLVTQNLVTSKYCSEGGRERAMERKGVLADSWC